MAAAVHRDGGRARDGRRRRRARQDEPRRVRDGLVDRELRVRPEPQSARPDSCPRRIERRIGRRGRRRHGAVGARLGDRGLGPPARIAVRRRRRQADVWRGVALRPRRVRQQPRSDRSRRSERRRRRPPVRRHRRARPDGLDVDPGAGCVRQRRAGDRRDRPARGDRHRAHRCRRRAARGQGRGRRGRGRARSRWRDRRARLGPVRGPWRRGVLPHCTSRSVVEPVALRRRALRPAGRRRRRRGDELQDARRGLRR